MKKFVLIAICVLAFCNSLYHSFTIAPENAPDEQDHVAYAWNLWEQDTYFFPNFKTMDRDSQANPATLIHPPGYYFLAQPIIWSLCDVWESTSCNNIESFHQSNLKLLRLLSSLLFLISLLGCYFLALEVAHRSSFLWSLAYLVLIFAYPARYLTTSTFNNDALVMAVVPWMAYWGLKLMGGRLTTLQASLIACICALAIWAKATLWVLSLLWAAPFIFVAIREKGFLNRQKREYFVLAFALLGLGLSLEYPVGNLIRYGQLQPAYTTIRQIPLSESRFFSSPEEADRNLSRESVSKKMGLGVYKTFSGFLGQQTRVYRNDFKNWAPVFWASLSLLLGTIALALALYWKRLPNWKILTLVSVISLGLFTYLFWSRNLNSWYAVGRMGVQGRYFFGYYEFVCLAAILLSSQLQRLSAHLAISFPKILSGVILLCLLGLVSSTWGPVLWLRSN